MPIVSVGRRSARLVRVDVIGSSAHARAWLARADWFAVRDDPVVLVAPLADLLLPCHVARAAQLADAGSVVYVLVGSAPKRGIRPWRTVDWVDGPRGMLRARLVPDTVSRPNTVSRPSGYAGQTAAEVRRPVGPVTSPLTVAVSPRELSDGATSAGRDGVRSVTHRGGHEATGPVHRPTVKAPRRRSVATRLAGTGPAVAAYTERYRSHHDTGPSWADIARALDWPGDRVDHELALQALVETDWITSADTLGGSRAGRRWIELERRNAHTEAPAPRVDRQPTPAHRTTGVRRSAPAPHPRSPVRQVPAGGGGHGGGPGNHRSGSGNTNPSGK